MSNTVTQANITRFNAIADAWDDNPTRLELARAAAGGILENLKLTGTERAMEFGCGTGLVTALVAPNVASVLAVDSSAGMLEVLQRKTDELGLHNVQTCEEDLSRRIPTGPFDLIFSSMTLHHIADVAALFRRLSAVLAPGGRVALVDLEKEDGTFHGDTQGVMHHGFEPATVRGWLQEARFVDPQTQRVHVLNKTGADQRPHHYPIFLATAAKPA
ncbi:MAG: class I SAM-dependent methyltransferase [Gammaproteobacteria bacterium]